MTAAITALRRLAIAALIPAAASCQRTFYAPTLERRLADSVAVSQQRIDTIMVHDSIVIDRTRGDTIRELRQRTLYRSATVRDTLRLVCRDTVVQTIHAPASENTPTARPSWWLPLAAAAALLLLLIMGHRCR